MEDLVPEAGNLESFIKQFPLFAGAPNGILKLRELILQLAITGRLTEKEANDGFAIELLSDAKVKKKSYEQTLNLRKAKALSPLKDDVYPYLIPSHWVWCQLNDLACYIQRGKGPKYSENDSSIVVSQKCIQWSGFDISKARGIDESALEKYGKERFLIEGDLLWNSTGTGTVGRVNIIGSTGEKSIVVDSHVTVIRLSNVEPRYIWCCISSPWVQSRIEPDHEDALVSGSTKQVELSTTAVKELPIALPPLEEQKRIVAKVDELMALCDTLEAQQQQQAQTVLRANTAAINALLNPDRQSEQNSPKITEKETNTTPENSFEQNWQRIAQHFNTLYGCTLPMPKGQGRKKKYLVGLENVKALRQVILKLAVNGYFSEKEYLKKEIFQNCITLISGQHLKPSEYNTDKNGIPYITGPAEFGNEYPTASKWTTQKRAVAINGDILITVKGSGVGKTNVCADEELAISRQLMAIRANDADQSFIQLVVLSAKSYFVDKKVGIAIPGIGRKDVLGLEFYLPSFEEQKRIVTKVDQLMALCDQLEQQLTQSYSDAEKLMQATVKALVA